MQAIEIVDRLKNILGFYTDDFCDVINITSLTRSGSTVTAVTDTDHELATNNYITIAGAKERIALTSLTRSDDVVTVVSNTDHKLTDPSKYSRSQLPLYVEISGVTPSEYNGTFELLSVPDSSTFTFKITDTPSSPASVAGYLLLEDQDGYNGYKQITKIDDTSFSYAISSTPLSPASGVITVKNASRIAYAATPERILDFYSQDSSSVLQNWMFVCLGLKDVFKDGTIANDQTTAQYANKDYWYQAVQNFSIFVVIPSKNTVLGGLQADQARSYEMPILKSIANYQFSSYLSDQQYQPVVYTGNETDDYIKAYYVHRFDFIAQDMITIGDTAAFNNGVPLEVIDGAFTDKSLEFKPNLR